VEHRLHFTKQIKGGFMIMVKQFFVLISLVCYSILASSKTTSTTFDLDAHIKNGKALYSELHIMVVENSNNADRINRNTNELQTSQKAVARSGLASADRIVFIR
jgi:hypothetical protein